MFWQKKRPAEVSSTEDELEDEEPESPTLVTVDNGQGGVEHIKLEGGSSSCPAREGTGSKSSESPAATLRASESGSRGSKSKSKSNGTTPDLRASLGDMLKNELREKKFLSVEKEQNRIVSKKGHVNIGKTRVSQR
jgi:hypothetical protein